MLCGFKIFIYLMDLDGFDCLYIYIYKVTYIKILMESRIYLHEFYLVLLFFPTAQNTALRKVQLITVIFF